MMVSPVSSVRFCANEAPKVDLAREGAHSKNAAAATAANPASAAPVSDEAAKKSGTGKKVLKAVIGLAVVAGVLAALPKMFKGSIKVLEGDALTDATKLQKVGHYLAKVGEAISDYTYRPILKLFKDKDAEKVAEAATEASEGVVA